MAEIETAQAGDLTDPATWVGGVLPAADDIARIMHPGCVIPAGQHFECGGIIESLGANPDKIFVEGNLTVYGDVMSRRGTILRISPESVVVIHGILRCLSGGANYGGFTVVNLGTMTVFGETYGNNNADAGAILENLGGVSNLLGGVAVQASRGQNLGVVIDGGEVNCPNGSGSRLSRRTWGGTIRVFDVLSGTLNIGGPIRVGHNCNFVYASGNSVVNAVGVVPLVGLDRSSVAFVATGNATLNLRDQVVNVPPGVVFQVLTEETRWNGGDVAFLSMDVSGLKVENHGLFWLSNGIQANVVTDSDTSITDRGDGLSIVTNIPGLEVNRRRGGFPMSRLVN